MAAAGHAYGMARAAPGIIFVWCPYKTTVVIGFRPRMLTRPAGHEAEARKSEAEDEAEA